MRLSRTTNYAIHALVYIARQPAGEQVVGHHAARQLQIPTGFLLRILVVLARAGILASVKGPNGGYRLARSPNSISILEVIEVVEGPLRGADTFGPNPDALERKLLRVFQDAIEQVRRQLGKVTLASLVRAAQG